jgi:hypothetical protein
MLLRTDSDVDFPGLDLVGDDIDGSETGGTLPVHSRNGDRIGNTSIESCHTGGGSAPSRWQDVADSDVSDEFRVELDGGVGCLQNRSEILFWLRILEAAFATLCRAE